VFVYVNRLRKNPASFLPILRERKAQYSEEMIRAPSVPRRKTDEGKDAVWDAIRTIEKTKPMEPLRWNDYLVMASREHVVDSGVKGIVSHIGSNGSTVDTRLSKYVSSNGANPRENNCFGLNDNGLDAVIKMLIDDGTADRANRANLLNPALKLTGIQSGPHSQFDYMVNQFFVACNDKFQATDAGRNTLINLERAATGAKSTSLYQVKGMKSEGKSKKNATGKHSCFIPSRSNHVVVGSH